MGLLSIQLLEQFSDLLSLDVHLVSVLLVPEVPLPELLKSQLSNHYLLDIVQQRFVFGLAHHLLWTFMPMFEFMGQKILTFSYFKLVLPLNLHYVSSLALFVLVFAFFWNIQGMTFIMFLLQFFQSLFSLPHISFSSILNLIFLNNFLFRKKNLIV